MKIVRVSYTVKADYAEQNQQNIRQVMADLQKLNHTGIHYHVCLGPDSKSFTHNAYFKAEEDQQILLGLPSFKHFQEQLKASGPEAPPKQEFLTLVGSSNSFFNS